MLALYSVFKDSVVLRSCWPSPVTFKEFHRYAHMTAPPPIVTILQNWGLIISRKDHGTHHISPFGEKYCIVSGTCNDALDKARV